MQSMITLEHYELEKEFLVQQLNKKFKLLFFFSVKEIDWLFLSQHKQVFFSREMCHAVHY